MLIAVEIHLLRLPGSTSEWLDCDVASVRPISSLVKGESLDGGLVSVLHAGYYAVTGLGLEMKW